MNRMLIVEKCGGCSYFDMEYPEFLEWCVILERKVEISTIPDDCPLPVIDEEVMA